MIRNLFGFIGALAALLATPVARTEGLAGQSTDPSRIFEGHGQLVTLRVEVADAKAKLFILGKKAAELDAATKPMIVKVTAKNDKGHVEELRFIPGQGYDIVEKLPDFQPPYTLLIQAKVQKKGKVKEEKIPVKVKSVL